MKNIQIRAIVLFPAVISDRL